MPATASFPLPTLLSWALVAFTIELDNEFEHRTPHWTTRYGGSKSGVWLASLVMWSNCMRFVGEDGARVAQLEELARTRTNLNGAGGTSPSRRIRSPSEAAAVNLADSRHGRLFEGLEPCPDGWWAQVPKPKTLTHFPMVLHRGGWPDGS